MSAFEQLREEIQLLWLDELTNEIAGALYAFEVGRKIYIETDEYEGYVPVSVDLADHRYEILKALGYISKVRPEQIRSEEREFLGHSPLLIGYYNEKARKTFERLKAEGYYKKPEDTLAPINEIEEIEEDGWKALGKEFWEKYWEKQIEEG